MTDRFSAVPLLRASLGSLRHRASVGRERRDVVSLVVITVIPTLMGLVSFFLGWKLREAQSLVGGLALLAAALLAVVVQLAAWRQRLTDDSHRSDAVARRSLDEAVANTLLATIICIAIAILSIVDANLIVPSKEDGSLLPLPAKILTAAIVGGGTYLVLTLLLIVNLLFDAYVWMNGSSDAGD